MRDDSKHEVVVKELCAQIHPRARKNVFKNFHTQCAFETRAANVRLGLVGRERYADATGENAREQKHYETLNISTYVATVTRPPRLSARSRCLDVGYFEVIIRALVRRSKLEH